MDVNTKNRLFFEGIYDAPGQFPQLEAMAKLPVQFSADFGLSELPGEAGLILIRGARQIGKSTWLEQKLMDNLKQFGAGSAIYLNGEDLLNGDALMREIRSYLPLFKKSVGVPKIFIDEITAIPNWELALKRLYDSGETRSALIITTGSKAVDLRRGTERLPGRKGRLARSSYMFTPIGFRQFKEKCEKYFHDDLLTAYILSGASPIAINELIQTGRIPEYVIELTRDWIFGECAAQGRSRNLLNWIVQALIERGGTPVALVKLAKESGSANNTVVRGYIDLLGDLMCLSSAYPVDASSGAPLARKAQKYHWINLLAAVSFHPSRIRTVKDFQNLSPEIQAQWLEWLVAQELWRRSAIAGQESPELQYFWQSDEHEIDFRSESHAWIEVKRGPVSASDFFWFPRIFPKNHLTVVSASRFESDFATGITLDEFLEIN